MKRASPREISPGAAPVTLARLLVLMVCLGVAAPAVAFRCGTDLIQEGDRKYDVIENCGEPDFRDRHAGAYLEGIGPVDITETWYYNQGPSRLIRILTFRHGRLRSVETGGRGFTESAVRRACDPYTLDIGMSKYELRTRCGEPVSRNSWFEHGASRLHKQHGFHGTVRVEEWIYVFGGNRFRRYIRMVNGRVIAIERGDKGG